METKNIVVFTRSTYHHFKSGGMETHLKNLLEGLSGSGFKITVFTTAFPNDPLREIIKVEKNIKYIFLKETTPGFYPKTKLDLLLTKLKLVKKRSSYEGSKNYFDESLRLFKILKRNNKFDLIISQSTSARKVIFSTNIPVISIIHGTILAEIKNRISSNKGAKSWLRFFIQDMPNWIYEKFSINKKFFERCDVIIAVSENLKHQFLYEYPDLKRKIFVIYNGVDDKVFSPISKLPSPFKFIYIGRIVSEKGVDIIIKAVKILLDRGVSDFKVDIVGDGPLLNELKDMVDTLGLSNINLNGAIDNELLCDVYKKSSVFVFPTKREEGHPMTVSESFCSGVPVISTPKGGLKNLIRNGYNGIFVNENDAKDLADKMELVMNDKDLLIKLKKGALIDGVKKYSQRVMITQYLKLVNSVK